MHIQEPSHTHAAAHQDAVSLVLGIAKRLHRAAISESLALSLPVLRRILAAGVLHGLSLPQLRRQRDLVQRKHLLRMLAIEAGYPGWEDFRRALLCEGPDRIDSFELVRQQAGYPNLWFSTFEEAQAHALRHGGRALRAGRQGIVLGHTGNG